MTYLERFAIYMLVLVALVFSVSTVMGADDVMILQYNDGSSQKVMLQKPSAAIRQIEFPESRRMSGQDNRGGNGIRVIAATYGKNCSAPQGNVTDYLAEACDGKATCEYVIDYRVIGDPAPGCPKNYIAEWQCGYNRDKFIATVAPEAGSSGKKAVLKCPGR